MIVITTPTGQVGAALLPHLLEVNTEVRVIARDASKLPTDVSTHVEVVVGSHQDPQTMTAALRGADALFLLVPPGPGPEGAHHRYLEFAHAATIGLRANDVPRVVAVTSAGHDWDGPAGLLSAAFAMDAALCETGVAYRALSMPWFMENFLGQLESVRGTGQVSMGYTADRVLPSVATRDIAAAAARLLLDTEWSGQENVPVIGPDRLTPIEMTQIAGHVLGRPLHYVQVPIDAVQAGFLDRGRPQVVADDVTQMIVAQNAGIYDNDVAASTSASAETSFQTWAETVLRRAFENQG